MTQIPPDRLKLEKFGWFEDLRPVDKDDVFNWRGKGNDNKLKVIERSKPPLQTLGQSPEPSSAEPAPEPSSSQPSDPAAGAALEPAEAETTDHLAPLTE